MMRIDKLDTPWIWLSANLAVWLALVFLFAQSIGLWQLLVSSIGRSGAAIVPFALSTVLGVAVVFVGRRRFRDLAFVWAALSLAVFLLGSLITDPAFPAKRIHVPEYFVLTIVVFWSLRNHTPDAQAIWGAVALAAMLGGIDEIIQGAMRDRTYGLRDILINGLGAVSAGLFLKSISGREREDGRAVVVALPIAIVAVGYGLLLVGASAHKAIGFPVWIYLPALASLPVLAVLKGKEPGRWGHARLLESMLAVCAIAVILMYGIDALDFDFR